MEEKNKIVLLGNANSIWIERWANAMNSKGFKIYVLSFEKPLHTKFEKNIDVLTFNASKFFGKFKYFIYYKKFKDAIDKIKPDIVHSHYAAGYGILGYLIKFRPFIVSVWGSDILRAKNPVSLSFLKKILKYADFITTTFENTRKLLVDKFSVQSEKIHTFFWGIDFKLYEEIDEKSIQETKKKLNIKDKDKVIFSFRSFAPVYNQYLIIEAAIEIIKSYKNIKFVFIKGHGSTTFLKKMEKKVINGKYKENFIFINAALSSKEMVMVSKIADIGISIPLTDQMSDTLLWFLYFQKILITGKTDFNLYVSNVLRYKKIFFVESKNIKENLIKIIKEIILKYDVLLKESLLTKDVETIKENFDINKSYSKMQEIYKKVLAKNQ